MINDSPWSSGECSVLSLSASSFHQL